jgi:GT2 family glycosyltransferase
MNDIIKQETSNKQPANGANYFITDLSIIIVCYKGWDKLHKCLESLDLFTGVHFSTEVIVVDNKSDDEIIYQTEARFSKFKFIYNKVNGGFANGCNLGAGKATGEFLLFLNPDTVASESEVEKLLSTAKQNPDFAIVSCRQVNAMGKESNATGEFPSILNLTGFERAIFKKKKAAEHKHLQDISFPDWVSGSVLMIRQEIYRKIGGFDEDYWMYFEDVDLCRRVRNIGGEIAFCSNVSIEHNHGGSSRINLKTTSLTKTEVYISRHNYISKNKTGFEKFIIQTFLVINNLISGGIVALMGLILFFFPKVFSRTLIFGRLIKYYAGTLFRVSWISPRSVNYK